MTENATRFACIGGNLESLAVLEGFRSTGISVSGVVCGNDTLKQSMSDYVDISQYCVDNDIPCLPTANANSDEVLDFLQALSVNYIFILGWNQILKSRYFQDAPWVVIGSHPTPIPMGKGRAPVPWTILENRRRSAVSLFKATEAADSGDVVYREWFDIGEYANARELYAKVSENLTQSFVSLYRILSDRGLVTLDALDVEPSVYARRRPADGIIDFTHTAEDIERLVRATTYPYPGAYCYHGDSVVRCFSARIADASDQQWRGVPGQLLQERKGAWLVQAMDGTLWLDDIQVADGTSTTGLTARVGDVLGYRVQDQLAELRLRLTKLENMQVDKHD